VPPQGFVIEEFEVPKGWLRSKLLRSPRLPAHIIALLIHAQQAQRLGLGQAVEVDDFDVADGCGTGEMAGTAGHPFPARFPDSRLACRLN